VASSYLGDEGHREPALLRPTLQPPFLIFRVKRKSPMCDASEFATSADSCRTPFLAVFLVSLCLTPIFGQKAPETSPPKYDPHTETKMKVKVDDVKPPPKGSPKEVVHLLAKDGSEVVDVYLCPQSFLDDMGVSFSKGDDIALIGSKVKQNGADLLLILAREVVKGDVTLVLRDG